MKQLQYDKPHLCPACIKIVCLFAVLASALICTVQAKPPRVLAIVEGKEITHEVVAVKPEEIRAQYRTEGRESPQDKDLRGIVLQQQKGRLKRQIQAALKEKRLQELGITASDAEVEEERKKVMGGISSQDIDKSNSRLRALFTALELAAKDPSKEREIYQQKVADQMPYSAWTEHRKKLDTLEKVKDYKARLPMTREHHQSILSIEQLRAIIKSRKLDAEITKDVLLNDREFRDYLIRERGMTVSDETEYKELKKRLGQEFLRMRKESVMQSWWKSTYRRASIKILDAEYKDVLGDLREDGK